MNFTTEHNTIRRYVQGKMSRDEQYAFESRMLEDPFLSDAVEGFEADPNALFDVPVVHVTETFWKSKWFWITHTAITIALIGFVLYSWMETEVVPKAMDESTRISVEPSRSEAEISPLPENEQISAAIAIEESPEMIEADPIEKKEVLPEVTSRYESERVKVPAIPTRNASAARIPSPKIQTSNVSFRYIHDLKVVHYGDFYREGVPTENRLEMGGTEARYEQPPQTTARQPLGLAPESPKKSYAESLDSSLGDFVKADYERALAGFNRILSTYPDDNNAMFYAGLCYYNLGNFANASHYFMGVEQHFINTFDQEAQWYRALSLARMGDREKSKALFTEISKREGHYADQARAKL